MAQKNCTKVDELHDTIARLERELSSRTPSSPPLSAANNKIGARQDTGFMAVSTAPSINKTPLGPTMVPIPYPTVQNLGNSINTARTVKFNGKPVYLLDQTTQSTCAGDAPGTGKGVRSGTVGGEVKPVNGSRTVRIEGRQVVRNGDPCTMNGGNNPGVYVAHVPPAPARVEHSHPSELEEMLRLAAANVGEAIFHPLEGMKGAIKGLVNTIPESAETLLTGAAELQALELTETAHIQSLLGRPRLAKRVAEAAQSTRESAQAVALPKFPLINSAQEGGNLVSIIVQLFAAGVGVAKLVTSGATKVLKQSNATLPKIVAKPSGDGVRVLRNASKARSVKIKDFLERKWGKDAVDQALARKRADPELDALLTDDEYLSLQAYTSHLFREINPALRAGNPSEWGTVVDEATHGLAKMREGGYQFAGAARRDASFDLKQLEELFPENGVFQDKAFVSSSAELDGVFPGNTQIQIVSKTGVNIKPLSHYQLEEEILFPPNTKFKVVGRTIDPANRRHIIVLEEIK